MRLVLVSSLFQMAWKRRESAMSRRVLSSKECQACNEPKKRASSSSVTTGLADWSVTLWIIGSLGEWRENVARSHYFISHKKMTALSASWMALKWLFKLENESLSIRFKKDVYRHTSDGKIHCPPDWLSCHRENAIINHESLCAYFSIYPPRHPSLSKAFLLSYW